MALPGTLRRGTFATEESEPAELDRRVLGRLLRYLILDRLQAAISVVAVIGVAGFGMAQPAIIGLAIDQGIRERDPDVLTVAALLFIGVTAGHAAASAVNMLAAARIGQTMLHHLRTQLFARYQRLSVRFFDRQITGRLISRIASDVEAIGEALSEGVLGSVSELMTLVGILAAMLLLNWQLTLIAITVTPAMFVAAHILARLVRRAHRRTRALTSTMNGVIAESILGMRVTQAFGREAVNLERFDEVSRAQARAHRRTYTLSSAAIPMVEIFTAVATGLVLWFGGSFVLGDVDGLTVGVVTAFVLYVERFFTPIQELAAAYESIQGALASGERVFEVLDTEPELEDAPDASELEAVEGRVRFEHVDFAYDEGIPVLRDVSLDAAPGDMIALVGATGSGKSTIINLLFRFYDVRGGAITIDGRDIRSVTQRSLRRHMALVLQEPFLFSGSIRDNITYARPDATEDDVVAAARTVRLDEFVSGLPFGYDTQIEERGGGLSLGQRQLVSFARAILMDPRILVLDEATSSVDTQTEALVQEALESLMRGRTTFVIAHRLSTVRKATEIAVLDSGRIIERGSHADLLALEGLYHRLYNLGFSTADEVDAAARVDRPPSVD